MKIEKREHVRYLPPESAFAALGKRYSKVGRLKDISVSGVAFEYFAGETSDSEDDQVDIFLISNGFHLFGVPCEVVYEKNAYVPHVENMYVNILTRKRCGLKFKILSKEMANKLAVFLQVYTSYSINCESNSDKN